MAVYNSESTVVQALSTLIDQSVKLHLVVVDDGSTDKTPELIKSFIRKNPGTEIDFYHQNHLGPALARNLGAKNSRAEILLFVDADMTYDKDYATHLIAPIKGEVIGSYTSEELVSNWDNVWARCWNLEHGWQDGKRFPHDPPELGTDFRAIKKSAFDRVGGFDNIGYTDTWSLFKKLGVRPVRTRAICYHKNPGDLISVYRQAKWSAKRPYKAGGLGTIYALFRTSLPLSIFALFKNFRLPFLPYLAFKLVYDWGRFVGILEMIFLGKLAK